MFIHIACLQPLPGEVSAELGCARILEHPLHLRLEVGAQLAALRQAKQLVVRHRGPEQIRQPRGQGILVDIGEGGILWRFRVGFLRAEQKTRRRQHGDHRLRDALLKVFVRLLVDQLGNVHKAVERFIVGGTAEGLADEALQHFAGVLPAFCSGGRRLAPEEDALIGRHIRPVFGVQRAFQPHGNFLQDGWAAFFFLNPLFAGGNGVTFQFELMNLARLPMAWEFVVQCFYRVLPAVLYLSVFPRHPALTSQLEAGLDRSRNEPRTSHLHHQMVIAGLIDLEGIAPACLPWCKQSRG